MLKPIINALCLLAVLLTSPAFARNSPPEPLYSAQFTDQYLIIEVKSTGCTYPESFSILAEGKGGVYYSRITVVRDKPDRCRQAAHIIKVYLELPGALAALKEPYKLDNLFVSKRSL